jgi:hypothetical protein
MDGDERAALLSWLGAGPFKEGTVRGAVEDLRTTKGELQASLDTVKRRKKRVRKALNT